MPLIPGRHRGFYLTCALAAFAGLWQPPVHAQDTDGDTGTDATLSAADRAAFAHFTMTDALLAKWEGALQDPATPICSMAQSSHDKGSLDQRIRALDARPDAHAFLARHGLSARDYMLFDLTLIRLTVAQARHDHPRGLANAGIGDDAAFQPSAANLAFYRQHGAEIMQAMWKVARERVRKNAGRPECAGGAG